MTGYNAKNYESRQEAEEALDFGITFEMRGKIDAAIKAFKRAIDLYSEFPEAYNKLGDVYQKKGDFEQAITAYEMSKKLNPLVENTYFDLGCVYTAVGRYHEALNYFFRALEMDPKHHEIYGKIGYIYLKQERITDAIVEFRKAIELNDSDIPAKYNLAICLLNAGPEYLTEAHNLFNSVIERYNQLIKVKDNYAEGHYFIGKCHYYMRNYEEASRQLAKAVELDTDDVDYHFSFGLTYWDQDALFDLAQALVELNESSQALDNVKQALALEPERPEFQELYQKLRGSGEI